jgi:DNA-binding CsgD family transcriptional regulator
LAPRLRRTLGRLLLGESEKRIALQLQISRHTVHEYVGLIYRHFGVSSRAELMAMWVREQQRGRR